MIQFLHKEKVHPTQIHRRLAPKYGLKPTVFEASNLSVNFLTAGAKTYTVIRYPEDL
jgi:hypothetical protein